MLVQTLAKRMNVMELERKREPIPISFQEWWILNFQENIKNIDISHLAISKVLSIIQETFDEFDEEGEIDQIGPPYENQRQNR